MSWSLGITKWNFLHMRLMSVLPWLRRQSVLCYAHKAEAALRNGSRCVHCWLWLPCPNGWREAGRFRGLLVPNLRFVFKQVARLRRSVSQRHITWGLLILNKAFVLRQVQLRVHISHAKAAVNRLPGGHMPLFFFNPRTFLVVQMIILLLASDIMRLSVLSFWFNLVW